MKTKSLKQFLIVLGLMVGAISLSSMLTGSAFAFNQGDENIVAPLTNGEESGRGLIITLVQYLLGFLGLVAVVVIIYGGFLYVTSAGNDDQVGSAKNMIKNALIGIVIIILSFVLVETVLDAGTGVPN